VGKRKIKPPAEATPELVLKRALQLKPKAVALVVIGQDGYPLNMWSVGSLWHHHALLTLSGAAHNLSGEVSWSITQRALSKIFPKPQRVTKRKPRWGEPGWRKAKAKKGAKRRVR
jgi:hypothetical protein